MAALATKTTNQNLNRLIAKFLKTLIRAYHWLISPWLGSRCRFAPTCSDYASQAIDQHGSFHGSVLAAKRLCRCHPWGGQGYDPVPEIGGTSKAQTANPEYHPKTEH